jgi:hypothetical protein
VHRGGCRSDIKSAMEEAVKEKGKYDAMDKKTLKNIVCCEASATTKRSPDRVTFARMLRWPR